VPRPARRWNLPLVNGLAIAAIIAGVGYRIWESNLPSEVRAEEVILIGIGVVFAGIAVAVKVSRLANNLIVQLPVMITAAVLAVLVLGVAGPWLGNDLPPLAAVSFAAVFLHFDVGLRSQHFGYVLVVAVLGLGALWVYAVTQLMVTISAVAIWTLLLGGLGLLALLTSRAVERDLGVQVERQSSLLATLSDIGEGLLITEGGRFVAGNDAYVNLTGYSREELAAMPSLIDMAPPEDRDRLAASLARRLSGGEAPARYSSALITKSGRRVEVEVAIHRVTSRRDQLLTLVGDITERLRAEGAERESETRFRTLFEQAQAGMAFTSLDGHITTVNPAFCELVGYDETELRTLSLLDITHPDDTAALREAMHTMLSGEEEGRRMEKRYTRKDGEHVWVDLTMRLVRDMDAKPMSFRPSRSTSATASAPKCCRPHGLP
jgi:PAS domain S-box-containing protein